jgi:hypothetical protein
MAVVAGDVAVFGRVERGELNQCGQCAHGVSESVVRAAAATVDGGPRTDGNVAVFGRVEGRGRCESGQVGLTARASPAASRAQRGEAVRWMRLLARLSL